MKKKKWFLKKRYAFLLFAIIYVSVILYNQFKPLPEGISYQGDTHQVASEDIEFLHDLTYQENEEEKYEQEIFDTVYQSIENAEEFIILDMFMINEFSSEARDFPEISKELSDKIATQIEKFPDLKVVVISDPLNTTYYSHEAKHLAPLEDLGVELVYTDLERLRDPNPLYSGIWRMFIQWFGQEGNGWVKNPFGKPGPDVTIRSYLKTLNIKANHRKVLVTENEGLILSANPHDASGFHSNIGFKVKGEILKDIIESEKAVAKFSGGNMDAFPTEEEISQLDSSTSNSEDLSVTLVTEQKIEKAVVDAIEKAEEGDQLWIGMFYIADRTIITALEEAGARGVEIRFVLDPNSNAFGQQKIGIPNIPIADELLEDGHEHVQVKWYNVNKEQFHTKILYANYGSESTVIGGSTNYTSRNLDDYNLETNLVITGASAEPTIKEIDSYFKRLWNNEDVTFTLPYESQESLPILKRIGYTLQKLTMFTTF